MKKATVLVVDDKSDIRLSLRFLLTNHNFDVLEASDLTTAREQLSQAQVDLVLLDMNYEFDTTSGQEGLDFIRNLDITNCPPIIAMTAWSSVDLAVAAMQLGARDFFAKPWDNHAVIMMVQKHLALAQIETKKEAIKPTFDNAQETHLLWHSAPMQQLKKQLDRIAATDATVFLRGENGTGKSCIAHYLHNQSQRSGQFVSVNMAAITESLFESELFGHKKGAFTDAKQDRVGRFEAADLGSLFLDEIGVLPQAQQAKLLRVLESSEYERVGDSQTRTANCRVICASNADFEQLIKQGEFRTDLYYRLNTIELTIPPLRDRPEDILPLAEYFMAKHSHKYRLSAPQLSAQAKELLYQHDWPGNVRELSHLMARAVLMNDTGTIEACDIALQSGNNKAIAMPMMTLEDAERKLLKMAMLQSNNHVEDAATLLGISKSAIYRRLEKFNIKTK